MVAAPDVATATACDDGHEARARPEGHPGAGERAVRVPAYASVVLDVDSTLCGVEGIDWLATRCGSAVSERVAELTRRAMIGEIALDAVYGERLALVAPTWESVLALSRAYAKAMAPGAANALYRIREAGVHIVLVSGGIREA